MIHQILLLGSRTSFSVKTLANNLVRAGYDVSYAGYQTAAGRIQEKFDAGILFLDGELLEHTEMISSFGALCVREKKPMFMIGTPKELEAAGKHIPEGAEAERAEKPLNIRKFLHSIHKLDNSSPQDAPRLILLVDDDPDYLKLVSRWLSGKYRVVIVSSGMQAIGFLGSNRPDLILLDYSMPVTSGPQVLEMMRSEESTASIPVFFLTGKDDSESVKRVLELKPEGYILKDISRSALLERLEHFFAGLSERVRDT